MYPRENCPTSEGELSPTRVVVAGAGAARPDCGKKVFSFMVMRMERVLLI